MRCTYNNIVSPAPGRYYSFYLGIVLRGVRLFTGYVVFARLAVEIPRQSEVVQLLSGLPVGAEAYRLWSSGVQKRVRRFSASLSPARFPASKGRRSRLQVRRYV